MCNHSLIICRCEEVTIDDIQDAINAGATTSQEMKMASPGGDGTVPGQDMQTIIGGNAANFS
ncbi:(2Fe-2S)-binding protein [Neobacillus sp. PS3-34]|uniref:(2Fe-2S)-binding protein n=1 Tax=Neobacillus sp. PS3-34 TaxID=3070678 RepID=UPI0027E1BB3A|nr:(2Fe-2S)-binding protein [Neobacillus sp. PS3-34]WML48442.1 (2Fe-2S)-binding protein [Neobacillus sp. PS3-34]